uniref:Squamosa promoter-binding-like protein 7 n=1 Tax=Rhizophora mucronata TaxID=61149 RepID=A0A2P2LXE0_RHIMU
MCCRILMKANAVVEGNWSVTTIEGEGRLMNLVGPVIMKIRGTCRARRLHVILKLEKVALQSWSQVKSFCVGLMLFSLLQRI